MQLTIRRLLALLASLSLLAAACGSDDDSAADDTAADDTAADDAAADDAAASTPADLQLSESDLGEILVDAAGRTLYLFTPDAQGDSTCYDDCEANWPVIRELAEVGDGLDASLLGTVERTDGSSQATYNGWPLYLFINDAAPGDANGQGINDVWWAIDADGNAVGG